MQGWSFNDTIIIIMTNICQTNFWQIINVLLILPFNQVTLSLYGLLSHTHMETGRRVHAYFRRWSVLFASIHI